LGNRKRENRLAHAFVRGFKNYESDFNTGYELLSYAEIPLLALNHAVSFALTCLLVRQLILHPKSGQRMEAGK
jgi:hypothetical protein